MPSSRPSPQRRGRGYRRRQSHAAAQGQPFHPRKFPDHPLIHRGEPELIQSDAALSDLLEHVRQVQRCAYDSEFIGESFYHPHLCLVQIATSQRVAVIDALAQVDLRPVWDLLADDAVEKVVHAGTQDLEPVMRHLGQAPAAVFDTQIIAGMVGLPYPLSLRRLVGTLLNVRLGKGLTFTSWDQRPLSAAHLHYAADDVRFGPALHAELSARLARLDRLEWAEHECQHLCQPGRYQADLAQLARKMRGARELSPSQGAVLYELVIFRDEMARLHDLPPRSTLRDEVLIDLARRMPATAAELEAIRGLPRPVKADFGPRLLDAVTRGLEKRQPPWPQESDHEESPVEQFRIDMVWAAVQAYCRSRAVDPALVCNRPNIAHIVREFDRGSTTEGTVMDGWQGDLLAEFLPALLSGQAPVTLHGPPHEPPVS